MKMNKSKMKLVGIIICIVIAVLLLLIFGTQGYQNKAFALEEQVNSAQSAINIQEKRRSDLIGNLVECVKEYDKYEASTLEKIVSERGQVGDVNGAMTAIAAVAEAYPELKSNENYKQLMNELSMTENMIAEHREYFNSQVKEYNRYVRKFPTRVFLNLFGYDIVQYKYLEYDTSADAPTELFQK